MKPTPPSFASGYMAGAAFVQVVSGRGPVERWEAVSVARRDGGDGDVGEVEIRAHRDSEAAAAHCESRGYGAAVVWSLSRVGDDEVRAAVIHVLARHEDRMQSVGCVDCIVRLRPELVVKIAEIDVREEFFAAFLDGFAEGCIKDDVALAVPPRFTPREDARRLGVAVGEALAAELARLIDGQIEPTKAIGIRILPGADAATVTLSDVELGLEWDHECATRQGATIRRGAGILVIGVPAHWGSSCLLLLALEVSTKKKQVRTSTVAAVVSDSDEVKPDGIEFLAGLHDGIARHARAADVLTGFGVLGPYRRRKALWDQPAGDRLRRRLRRAWDRIRDVSLFQRSNGGRHEKIMKLGIQRDPSKVYAIFDGDVYAMPNRGSDNVIVISSERSDYELVCTTGVRPELGYIYFLDRDGDLGRRRV